jgi:hypothetical protein
MALLQKCFTSLGIRTGSGSDRVASSLRGLYFGCFARVASVQADPVATAPGSDTATRLVYLLSVQIPEASKRKYNSFETVKESHQVLINTWL